jgi:S1-C subfamily serine protease
VLDKPADVRARGIMTWDGHVYAIREVLAGSKSDDVALFRIEAPDLAAAPLSLGDLEGSAVTVLSHPDGNFYSLTQGYISRYYAATFHGNVGVKMAITADFADGASGGPVFNTAGAVTGLVSSTDAIGNQMVRRLAVPARAIWDLIEPPSGRAATGEQNTPEKGAAGETSPDAEDAPE